MIKTILLDANILLDVFGQRDPHYNHSAAVWSLVETDRLQGYISAISYNNIFYIINGNKDMAAAHKALEILRGVFKTVELDQKIINMAIDSKFKDFEDAIQYFSAVRIQADCILTRNQKDFKSSDIPVYSPVELLALL